MLRSLNLSTPSRLILAACLLILAPAVSGDPSEHGLGFGPHDAPPRAVPPLPDPADLPIQLVIDDGSAESVFGFSGSTSRQFLWFNRFEMQSPFTLTEIWVLFPTGQDVQVGDAIQLAVYLDPDGDPTNGAQLLATYDETVQVVDGTTFSVYTIPGLLIDSSADILLGVVNRYYMTGIDPPGTMPAAVDSSTNQARSFFALWTGDPPASPDLASADTIDVLSGTLGGNLTIRGFGNNAAVIEVPTLDTLGLALLATLLAIGGSLIARRRRLRQ